MIAYCHIGLWTKLLTTSPSRRVSSRGSMQGVEASDGPTPGYLHLIDTNVGLHFWRSYRAGASGRLGRNHCKPTAPVCPLLCMSFSFSSPVSGPLPCFSRLRNPRFRTGRSRGECLRHTGNSTTCPWRTTFSLRSSLEGISDIKLDDFSHIPLKAN